VIEPVVDVHKKDLAHLRLCDGTVYDPLNQRQKGDIIVLGRNQLDHPNRLEK
jgi:hypothetical protein